MAPIQSNHQKNKRELTKLIINLGIVLKVTISNLIRKTTYTSLDTL